jgi:putative oxidoreductase
MFQWLEDRYKWAQLPLRIGLAALFLYAGIVKFTDLETMAGFFGTLGFPAPMATLIFVAAVETLGGAALLLGLYTRIAAALLAIILVVASVVTFNASDMTSMGMTMQLVALIGALLSLLFSGPGKWSLDEKWLIE